MKFLAKGFYLLCMLVFAVGMAACSDDNKDGDTPPPPSPLTPDEHKAKLETVGKDFIAKFNAEDHRTAVETIDYLIDILETSGLFGEDDEDTPIVPDYNPMVQMLSSLRSVAKSNSLNGLTNLAAEVDKVSLADYAGVYTYNESNEEWDKVDATGKIELNFNNGKVCVLALTFEGGKDYVYENTAVNIPAKMTVSLKVDGSEQIGASVNTSLADNQKSADVAVKMTLNGGYAWDLTLNAKSNVITEVYKMSKNGETLINSSAEITGQNLTDPDALENSEAEDLLSEGELSVNIMDVVVKGQGDIKAIIKGVDAITESSSSKTGAQKEADIYNKYASMALYYSGGSEKVADVKMDIVKDEDDNNVGYEPAPSTGKMEQSVNGSTSYEYYYTTPVLIFASDGSKYDMETYFSEANFGSLIQSVKTLVNKYAAMVGETVDF